MAELKDGEAKRKPEPGLHMTGHMLTTGNGWACDRFRHMLPQTSNTNLIKILGLKFHLNGNAGRQHGRKRGLGYDSSTHCTGYQRVFYQHTRKCKHTRVHTHTLTRTGSTCVHLKKT